MSADDEKERPRLQEARLEHTCTGRNAMIYVETCAACRAFPNFKSLLFSVMAWDRGNPDCSDCTKQKLSRTEYQHESGCGHLRDLNTSYMAMDRGDCVDVGYTMQEPRSSEALPNGSTPAWIGHPMYEAGREHGRVEERGRLNKQTSESERSEKRSPPSSSGEPRQFVSHLSPGGGSEEPGIIYKPTEAETAVLNEIDEEATSALHKEISGPLDALQIVIRDRDVWKKRAISAEKQHQGSHEQLQRVLKASKTLVFGNQLENLTDAVEANTVPDPRVDNALPASVLQEQNEREARNEERILWSMHRDTDEAK